MRTTIYCFSGTGNSFSVAKGLSERLDNSRIIKVTDTTRSDTSSDCIGFVFPVYLYGVPEKVQNLMEKLPHCNRKIFAVATYKSQPGNVLGQVQKLLAVNKNTLYAGYTVSMPGNNIIYYELEPERVRTQKLCDAEARLDGITSDIKNCLKLSIPKVKIGQRIMTSVLHRILTKGFHGADKDFFFTDSCQGCGLCEKICPVNNIIMSDGKPVWLHNCQQCTACLNTCPQKAIQFGKMTLGKERYINPDVQITELISAGQHSLQN